MVAVNPDRCAYCGGCVSVCPVEALTLAETRLLVGEECIECGDCVPACPVGALTLEGEPISPPPPVRRRYDLTIVGAGPGGAMAAYTAARAGLSVLLLEKRQEIGSPVRCAEGVGRDALAQFLDPDPHWISAVINRLEITAVGPNGNVAGALRAEGGRGYILERRVFDRALAERAAQAGAEVRVKTAASGLLTEAGRVRGVRIRHGDLIGGGQVEVEAQIVIGADGVEAQVGRWAGLDVQLPLQDTMVCVQYLLAGVDVDPACTAYTIGQEIASGGYAWVFPKGEGRANVGLGAQADLRRDAPVHDPAEGKGRAGDGTVLGCLTRFVECHRELARGYPVTLVAGNVPVALAPSRLVLDGLMLVGDSARQVDPLTGGGILNAMMAGQLAAQVAVEAIAAHDTSAGFLSRYPQRWHRAAGRKLERNYRLREKFPPNERIDERFLHAFALAAK